MADTRTLREKLEAMAERGTPAEATIARTKLDALGAEPPRRPTTAIGAAGWAPQPMWWSTTAGSVIPPIFTHSGNTAAASAPFANIIIEVRF